MRLRNHILVYSRATVSSDSLAAPPASPDLLLCSSSRKCRFSFIPSRVFSASGKVVSAQAVETSLSASCL
ncbi:hypothetical protein F2Q70_00011923 [Brassica cretica]|uniref:Uncharacterized protein n=1 Tax=Brassica cretica TaxID=69181 RepID=A0A8S9GCU1_BRACR|nr:hypothetical protein F2Q68_00031438 [Brassica cretica]KAF2612140.1 hypothetical protein F2Q70_00011923 [Brassica cretica]